MIDFRRSKYLNNKRKKTNKKINISFFEDELFFDRRNVDLIESEKRWGFFWMQTRDNDMFPFLPNLRYKTNKFYAPPPKRIFNRKFIDEPLLTLIRKDGWFWYCPFNRDYKSPILENSIFLATRKYRPNPITNVWYFYKIEKFPIESDPVCFAKLYSQDMFYNGVLYQNYVEKYIKKFRYNKK